ncbi:unnamed protein product [Microthlaspi erraticum]|uniref:Uncharacterized protein n=1 Tax=Microthlaspi erraticum TaxID=1685480 RepID=A0A6D2KQH7_9BRAS|nr:unnamed protein product [Microthlaspi erraticum]CAA7056857.1 unnamed protein product [Microthlaspi erraticum]
MKPNRNRKRYNRIKSGPETLITTSFVATRRRRQADIGQSPSIATGREPCQGRCLTVPPSIQKKIMPTNRLDTVWEEEEHATETDRFNNNGKVGSDQSSLATATKNWPERSPNHHQETP